MKKNIIFIVLIAMVAMTMQSVAQQYSVRRIVHAQFVAGNLTITNDTMCSNSPSQLLTGTVATGGKPSPANTYQWQYSFNTSTWTNIIGAVDTNLSTGILAPGDYQYRRIDNNPGCGSTDTTNTLSIHVWNNFLAGTATGGGNFCNMTTGTTSTCTPASGGDPLSITQEVQTSPDGTTWTATGNTTLSYTPTGLMSNDLYVRWEFISNCGIRYSNILLYNVYDPFIVGTASTTTISPICNGANGGTATATNATGGAPSITVEWETSTNGITYNNTGNFTLAYSFGVLTAPIWARLRYMNSCDTLYSNILFIDVYTALTNGGPSILIGNDTICFHLDPGNINAPVATNGTGVYNYQWRSNFNNSIFTNIIGATTEDYDIPTLTIAGTYQYQRITTDACGSVNGDTITIFMYEQFNAGMVGTHDESCSGFPQTTIIEITPASGGTGVYSYQWIESMDEITWNNAPGVSISINYTPPTVTTPVQLEYYYRRNVIDTVCGTETSIAPVLP